MWERYYITTSIVFGSLVKLLSMGTIVPCPLGNHCHPYNIHVELIFYECWICTCVFIWNPWMFLLDYNLLCGILSNPYWLFGWPPAYLYEWVDGVHDWFCLLLVSCFRISMKLPLTFCSNLVRLWLGCRAFMFIVIYPLLNFIWWDYGYVFKTWDMVLKFIYSCIIRINTCWGDIMYDDFLLQVLWNWNYACFEKTELLHPELFWFNLINCMDLLHSGFRML